MKSGPKKRRLTMSRRTRSKHEMLFVCPTSAVFVPVKQRCQHQQSGIVLPGPAELGESDPATQHRAFMHPSLPAGRGDECCTELRTRTSVIQPF
eukprot:474901-Amphidinium_carterae.1